MVISLEHPLYEERLRDRTRVNGNKLEHMNMRKSCFEGEQVTRRGCEASFSKDTQNLVGPV